MQTRLTKAEARAKMAKRMTPLGKALRLVGAVRVHDDGDGLSCVFQWWHPASWLVWAACVPVCAVVGERIAEVVPFRVNRWFRENPDRLQWL